MQIFGTHDDATRAQLAKVAERARKVALMADGHVGYVMPIGGVAAYDNAVSVVGVGFDMPYSVSGVTERNYHGTGLIVDAERGLVVTDRNTVPVAVGDVRITFAGTIEVPGKVEFIHPLHNLAVVSYDPKLIGDTTVKAAKFNTTPLKAGEDVWAIGFPMALDLAVTQGRFQHVANGKLYTSAWITAGVSGGGLVRCNHGGYELAGIMRDYVAFVRGGSYVNASQSTSTPAESILAFIGRVGGT